MKKRLTEQEVISYLREICAKHGDQKVIAEKLKISTSYLNEVLSGKRGVADKVADGLGYRREITFVKAP